MKLQWLTLDVTTSWCHNNVTSTVQEWNYKLRVVDQWESPVNVADSFLLQICAGNTATIGSLVNVSGIDSSSSITNI
jgi:hypothetical protein